MDFLSWVIVGLIAGVLAKMIMKDNMGWVMTILLGVVGAIVGGWVFGMFGGPAVSGINFTSVAVATVGAIIVLFVAGWLQNRR